MTGDTPVVVYTCVAWVMLLVIMVCVISCILVTHVMIMYIAVEGVWGFATSIIIVDFRL